MDVAPPVLVELTRGPLVEAIHRGHLAVMRADGTRLASVGDPAGKVTYWRSSAKPFQAMPLVETGAHERFGLDSRDLAICSASHMGEPMHVERVLALLERIGCDQDALSCGAHLPYDEASANVLRAAGQRAQPVHNNCSGKHAGMLALARHLGAPLDGYAVPDHPVQLAIASSVRAVLGVGELRTATDGCGVPTFAMSVEQMALAFARLAAPETLADPQGRAARLIGTAMRAHPELVAGTARFDTDLMRASPRLTSKGGASGVQCVGIEGGVGLALKIDDGSVVPPFSRGVAMVEALRQIGALDAAQVDRLAAHSRPVLRNVAGSVVGEVRPAFQLQASEEKGGAAGSA